MLRSPPWIKVATTSKARINIFCVENPGARHVASLTAASKKRLEQFRSDAELMRCAPELLSLLYDAAALFSTMNHIIDPKLGALRRRIEAQLLFLERGDLAGPEELK